MSSDLFSGGTWGCHTRLPDPLTTIPSAWCGGCPEKEKLRQSWGLCPAQGQGEAWWDGAQSRGAGCSQTRRSRGTWQNLLYLSLSFPNLQIWIPPWPGREIQRNAGRWKWVKYLAQRLVLCKDSEGVPTLSPSCQSSPREPVTKTTRWNFSWKYHLLIKQERDYLALTNKSHVEFLNSCEDTYTSHHLHLNIIPAQSFASISASTSVNYILLPSTCGVLRRSRMAQR